MTTLLTELSKVSAFMEPFFYIAVTIAMAVVVVRYTE